MSLQLEPKKSKWWYGRVTIEGRKINKNLGVEMRGAPPPTLSQVGDPIFERSRAKAQAALERLQSDLKKRASAEELVQTLHTIRTGARIGSIPLNEIGSRWKGLPRRRPLNSRYVAQAESWIAKFVDFISESNPAIHEMAQVQSGVARAFMKTEEERGVSPKTYNSVLIFLRSCFETLKEDGGIPKNPFLGIPTREEDPIFRKPFSAEELEAIVLAAKDDPFIYPIIVTGICTAMRRGDCCMLLKSAIDLPNRFIRVKTSKTGGLVQIPIFPLLQELLEKLEPNDDLHAFPEQAKMYQTNPDNITLRVRKALRTAGFFDSGDVRTDESGKPSLGEIRQARANGLRKASIRDFHSFRVTWVTLALSAGVPMEIVQKVTGHRTAGIVLKHYFQPDRENFRRSLVGKLPELIGGAPCAKPIDPTELRTQLIAMQPDTWLAIRDRLLSTHFPLAGNATESGGTQAAIPA